jgi:hypothetical protein
MKLIAIFFTMLFLCCITAHKTTSITSTSFTTDNAHSNGLNNTLGVCNTNFGVMVAKSDDKFLSPERQVEVAKELGVKYVRGRIDIKAWSGTNAAYDTYINGGLKVILNINYGIPRNSEGDHDPVHFPVDLDKYSKSVSSILDKYKPELVVIENEEDNLLYHIGSAEEYINELKAGAAVAHSNGLKVTNGGLTVREVCLIMYDDYLQHGEQQKAQEFAKKVFPDVFMNRLNNTDNKKMGQQIEFGRKVIKAYKDINMDYVNFHWYEPVAMRFGATPTESFNFDESVFISVANYLKQVTGKPVINNEFGVFITSPKLIKNLLNAVYKAGLRYAIFYSADGGAGKAVALQNGNGTLRENGKAFREYVKSLK